MDVLARQYFRQAHASGQHRHPDLARHCSILSTQNQQLDFDSWLPPFYRAKVHLE